MCFSSKLEAGYRIEIVHRKEHSDRGFLGDVYHIVYHIIGVYN